MTDAAGLNYVTRRQSTEANERPSVVGRLCSPFIGMGRKRTEEEKQKLYDVLKKYSVGRKS